MLGSLLLVCGVGGAGPGIDVLGPSPVGRGSRRPSIDDSPVAVPELLRSRSALGVLLFIDPSVGESNRGPCTDDRIRGKRY